MTALVLRAAFTSSKLATTLVSPEGREIPVDGNDQASEPLMTTGLWTIRDADGRAIGGVVVDIELAAADLTCQPPAAIRDWIGSSDPDDLAFASGASMPELLKREDRDTGTARILLAILLVLVIVESILSRRFSHGAGSAERGDPGVAASVSTRSVATSQPARGAA